MKIGICSFSPKIRSGSTGQTHLPVGAKWLLSLVGPVLWFAIGPSRHGFITLALNKCSHKCMDIVRSTCFSSSVLSCSLLYAGDSRMHASQFLSSFLTHLLASQTCHGRTWNLSCFLQGRSSPSVASATSVAGARKLGVLLDSFLSPYPTPSPSHGISPVTSVSVTCLRAFVTVPVSRKPVWPWQQPPSWLSASIAVSYGSFATQQNFCKVEIESQLFMCYHSVIQTEHDLMLLHSPCYSYTPVQDLCSRSYPHLECALLLDTHITPSSSPSAVTADVASERPSLPIQVQAAPLSRCFSLQQLQPGIILFNKYAYVCLFSTVRSCFC